MQGNAKGISSNDNTATATLAAAPTVNNTLYLVAGTASTGGTAVNVSSISQTGVTWTRQTAHQGSSINALNVEIWAGIVAVGASTTVTVILDAVAVYCIVDVCEYQGLALTGTLDKTAGSDGFSSTPSTGTTALTTQATELVIGGILAGYNQSSASNGFTLLDGVTGTWSLGFLEKFVTAKTTAGTSVTMVDGSTYYSGAIATFKFACEFTNITANTTVAGNAFQLSTNISDVNPVSNGVFWGTNNTGVWVNSTQTAYANNPVLLNGTWNTTLGAVVSVVAYMNDSQGVWASQLFNFTLTDVAPNYLQYAAMPIQQGLPCNFTAQWNDNLGLSGWIFEENTTGTPTNTTWAAFTVNPGWANITKTLPNVNGSKVTFQWYTNDTSNNWATTGPISLTVTNQVAPSYYNITYSTTLANAASAFMVQWQGINGLSGYIFSSNSTGSWLNYTYATLTNNPDFAITLLSLPATVGAIVGFRWFANDTDGNWGDTGIQALTVTALPNTSSSGGGGGTTIIIQQVPQVTEPPPAKATPMNNFAFTVGIIAIIMVSAVVVFNKNLKKTAKKTGEWK